MAANRAVVRSAISVQLLKKRQSVESFCVMEQIVVVTGSRADGQSQNAAPYASLRSRLFVTRNSSLSVPPSPLLIPRAQVAESIIVSRFLPSMSPAILSRTNWSTGCSG